MKEYLSHLQECLQKMADDDFFVSLCNWSNYHSKSVAIWVNHASKKGVLACDVEVMGEDNKDYFSATFFWRSQESLDVDSNAEVGSLLYWQGCEDIGYLTVEHRDGNYRLGKDYNITKIGYKEVAREIFKLFSAIEGK